MKHTLTLTAALILASQAALALTTDAVIDDLSRQGFSRIDVRNGATQMKVEAVRGTEKLEIVYDRETGAVLKQETGAVAPWDNTTPGVRVQERSRDFVRTTGRNDDGNDSNRGSSFGRDANDDDNGSDESGSSNDDDNGSDDNDNGGHDSEGGDHADGHDGGSSNSGDSDGGDSDGGNSDGGDSDGGNDSDD